MSRQIVLNNRNNGNGLERLDLIVTELKKHTDYGNRLLVDTFYIASRGSVSNYFNIPLYEAGSIVNDAFLKIIKNIDSFEYKSVDSLNSWIKKIVFNTARDYLRKKNINKNNQKNCGIEKIISLDNYNESVKDIESNNEDEQIYNSNDYKSEDIDILENVEEDLGCEDTEIKNLKADVQIFLDDDNISTNDKMKSINEIMETFSPDDQILLRLYLLNIPHKELAKIKNSNIDATRKYINRLLKEFFQRASNKFNLNIKEIYERYKEQNKRPNSKKAD